MTFTTEPRTRLRFRALHFWIILELLVKEGHTYEQLQRATGLNRNTVSDWVYEGRRKKLVYIEDWLEDRAGRRTVAVFRFGYNMDDAVRKVMPAAVKQRRYRERQKTRQLQQDITKALHVDS